jgi:predicted DNA-binding ribbon-helix-helix protein
MLEEFDRTGILAIDKIRRSFTIRNSTFAALKSESKATGRPMSALIDELAEKCLSERQRQS